MNLALPAARWTRRSNCPSFGGGSRWGLPRLMQCVGRTAPGADAIIVA
jgi:hypothetical protein